MVAPPVRFTHHINPENTTPFQPTHYPSSPKTRDYCSLSRKLRMQSISFKCLSMVFEPTATIEPQSSERNQPACGSHWLARYRRVRFALVIRASVVAVAAWSLWMTMLLGPERLYFRWNPSRSLYHSSRSGLCANVTVVVPLTPDRLLYTERLLNSIATASRIPCEIVFALSSSHSNETIISQIPQVLQSRIVILSTSNSQNAAENRNRAVAAATMPIVASLDSDDVASPLWIETIEMLFQANPGLDFVVHPWFWCRHGVSQTLAPPNPKEDLLHLNDILPTNMTPMEVFLWACCNYEDHPAWTNGHISFRRQVWETVQQRTDQQGAEDSWFTADLLMHGFHGVFVNQQLTGYCTNYTDDSIQLAVPDLGLYYRLACCEKEGAGSRILPRCCMVRSRS